LLDLDTNFAPFLQDYIACLLVSTWTQVTENLPATFLSMQGTDAL